MYDMLIIVFQYTIERERIVHKFCSKLCKTQDLSLQKLLALNVDTALQ